MIKNSRPFSLFLGTAASVALTFSVGACNKSQTPDNTTSKLNRRA